VAYRWKYIDVYWNSTKLRSPMTYLRNFRGISGISADYHQQYLAKNPDGCCPNHSCGIPYKSAMSYSGEKAR
jgi:hypothetical protein